MLFSVRDITVSTTVTDVQPLFQGKRDEQLLRGSIKRDMQSLDHWLTENNTDLLAVHVLSQNEYDCLSCLHMISKYESPHSNSVM